MFKELIRKFQCSSASRKFLNFRVDSGVIGVVDVSVLFSEPKIPQSQIGIVIVGLGFRFSALQRAENSSICGLVHAAT